MIYINAKNFFKKQDQRVLKAIENAFHTREHITLDLSIAQIVVEPFRYQERTYLRLLSLQSQPDLNQEALFKTVWSHLLDFVKILNEIFAWDHDIELAIISTSAFPGI